MLEIQSSSGLPAVSQKLQDFLTSDSFDEGEYDKAMHDAFNEAYYQASPLRPAAQRPHILPVAHSEHINCLLPLRHLCP